MNEVANRNYDMQTLMNLVGKQAENVNAISAQIGVIYEDMKEVKSGIHNAEMRLNYLENQSQVTYQQMCSIRKSVNARVYEILNIPRKREDRTDDDLLAAQKYSPIFHQRCYTEVSHMGHLASPYGCTTKQNFDGAIKDIEAWIPSIGVNGLKAEADKNAEARRTARELGYR